MSGRPSGSSTNTARRDPMPARHAVDPLAVAGGRAGAARRVAAAVAEGEVVEDHHRQAAAARCGSRRRSSPPSRSAGTSSPSRPPTGWPAILSIAAASAGRERAPLLGGAAGVRFGVEHPVGVLERILPLHPGRGHVGARLAGDARGGDRRRAGRDHAGGERDQGERRGARSEATHALGYHVGGGSRRLKVKPLHDDREEDHHVGHRQQVGAAAISGPTDSASAIARPPRSPPQVRMAIDRGGRLEPAGEGRQRSRDHGEPGQEHDGDGQQTGDEHAGARRG